MIALKENGQWERKTLRQLKTQFPNVSFRKTSEQEGASWSYNEIDYEAKLISSVEKPVKTDYNTISIGPLVDINGVPTESWNVQLVTQTEIDLQIEERVQSNTDDLLHNDKKFKVVLWLIYQIIKAINTGDNTQLNSVTSMGKLRDVVVSRFRGMN